MNKRPDKKKPDANNILEHISQCVIATDMEGKVTYWNRACERIFGYDRGEILDSSIKKIYPSVVKEQFYEDLKQLRDGQKVEGQWKTLTKDGKSRWVDINATPVKNDEGKPESIVATAHDIQELKQVEKELEENKARAQAILETTVDGIITVDETGEILSFNRSAKRIFGYTEEEVKGRDVRMLVPDTSYEQNDYISRSLESEDNNVVGYRREMRGLRKDGEYFPMELSISEVKWNGNRIFTCVINDISERRRLEQQILRVSEEERRSLGQDLHDGLGQMLTGIGLISQNLAQKLKSNGLPGAEEVQEISDLVKEADSYAKSLAHGLIQANIEEDGLRNALTGLSNQSEKLFGVNCSVHCDCCSMINNPMIGMNLYRIAQESVSNAVKHGKAQNVRIELKSENGSLELSIIDDGVGFPDEGVKDKKEKGMGINIMKYRANVMSGILEIKETEDNKTKVTCRIPYNNT